MLHRLAHQQLEDFLTELTIATCRWGVILSANTGSNPQGDTRKVGGLCPPTFVVGIAA